MGSGDCINIFMATEPSHTANGYWGLHQYLYGYSALSHCKWVLGIASIFSWLLSPLTLQMSTGNCNNIFMATKPCNTANGYWGLHQSSWLLSPLTLQMGTGDCINIVMATQPCNTGNGYWGLHKYLHGYSALSHCKWVLGIASISSWLLSPLTLQMSTGDCINIFMATQPCNTANRYWGLNQYLNGYSAL